MSLQFVFGPSGGGKSYYLYEKIIEEAKKDRTKDFLLIVPEQFTMQTQKELVERSKNHAIMNIDVLSFERLAFRVFDELGMYQIRILEETGKNIGYAFQIQDDILDVTSTTQELGKPVHSDEKNEKNTYVTVYGMEQAKEAVEAYSEKALTFLEQLPVQSAFLNTLVYALISRKK